MPCDATALPAWLDAGLYPDEEPPIPPLDLGEQVDFLCRLCGAWDFGVLPLTVTAQEIRQPEWREAVDACRLLTSAAYHLLRRWHGLEPLPYLGQGYAYIRDDPNLKFV